MKTFPNFSSLEALIEHFETHDLGDYLDSLPEVDFDVDIQHHKQLFVLDEDLANQLATIASQQHVSSERLINFWVREKITELRTA